MGQPKRTPPNRDVITIGTSAGGVDALRFLAGRLPADLPAAVIVTLHLAHGFRSELDIILSRAGSLPAAFATDGEPIENGRIYLAPTDRHLLIEGGHLSLGFGPRENNARPAIDPMFRSAALCCGHRSVGVVLTGALADGASGLHTIKRAGGLTVVQDPADASVPDMPRSALNRTRPDHVAPLAEVPALLQRLTALPAAPPAAPPSILKYEVEVARGGYTNMDQMDRIGTRSVVSCPDCGGVMWEVEDGDLLRYRCHVGHAYTAEHMNLAMDDTLRRALGSAARVLEERVALARRLATQAVEHGRTRLAESWADQEREATAELTVIREAAGRLDRISAEPTAA